MPFAFTEEEELFRTQIQEFAQKELAPGARVTGTLVKIVPRTSSSRVWNSKVTSPMLVTS